jgi:hypothetical protein
VPAKGIELKWETFTAAANEAGMSRRYGGIHFRAADLAGRLLGRFVAMEAWQKAERYFEGTSVPQTQPDIARGSLALSTVEQNH